MNQITQKPYLYENFLHSNFHFLNNEIFIFALFLIQKRKIMTNTNAIDIIIRARRNTQVVEGTGFENRQGSQARAGSNPASSARNKIHNASCVFILCPSQDQIFCYKW
jgi:hypothetical protein